MSEDSLWAVAGTMGADNAGLSHSQMGFALGLSTVSGLISSAAIGVAGKRFGRTGPIVAALALGGIGKFVATTTTDPTIYMASIIVCNTLYMITFIYIIAITAALDESGRWSGPAHGVYLIGSSFAPLFGTFISAALGYLGLGIILAVMSFVLIIPIGAISRMSARIEKENAAVPEQSPAPLATAA